MMMNQVVIGICIRDVRLLDLTTTRIRKFVQHFPYKLVDFICFHWKEINMMNYSVNGKKFNRKTEKWEDGTFPLPHVAFIQGYLNKEIIAKLENIFGINLFNNFLFDKWEGSEFLSSNQNLRKHVPKTLKLHTDHLSSQLCRFSDFFIKPMIGSSSGGIMRVKSLLDGSFEVFQTIRNEYLFQQFHTIDELINWLEPKITNGHYILQQAIETKKYRNNATDIRLNMNKNTTGNWEKSLLLFRISSNQNFIVPRKISQVYTFDRLHNSPSILPDINLKKLEVSIMSIGQNICQAFDEAGFHMADLGIDLGLDEKGKLWIFEVNHIPFPALGAIEDPSVYKPLEYAYYIANRY